MVLFHPYFQEIPADSIKLIHEKLLSVKVIMHAITEEIKKDLEIEIPPQFLGNIECTLEIPLPIAVLPPKECILKHGFFCIILKEKSDENYHEIPNIRV